ncbi:group II intron reverse transcriptase/maturase [Bacillus sp. V-88]|jgi:RNA-directed DNA polymerase|nr:group II intron reverse transcriptase/maturase [Bacillus sp. DSM 27956]PRX62508.1 group II intron reverse transcriptase/maturase [Bacillus sp. V-88]SLK25169.1 group II intron reverse transcriptase/maturase [Bacillus sp. V-88]
MDRRIWYSLYDKVFNLGNLHSAFKQVKKNKGAPGVDKVTIQRYEMELESNLEALQLKLKEKRYRPKPVRRKYIQKDDGKMRPLGIPTAEDRVVQAAVRNIIEPIFEEEFLPSSYGFRPGISAHMALDQVTKYLQKGYAHVVDADLQSYFDTIPHDKLLARLRMRIKDGSVLGLISEFLTSGVMEEQVYEETIEGAPQGGVLSPLLSNIYLHQLDLLMEERGQRIVRFADDFIILCKSKKGAERVMNGVTKYLENELGLRVHPTKSKVVDSTKEPFTFLGYEFYRDFRRIDPKKLVKFKDKVKRKTRKNQTVNIEVLIKEEINPLVRGWGNYFRKGNIKTLFRTLDSWIRRRLRMVQLRSWRHVKSLHRILRRKGWKETNLKGIRMFSWRSSKSPMIHGALDNKFFSNLGLVSLETIHTPVVPKGD